MVLHVQPFCGFFTKIYDSVFDEGAPGNITPLPEDCFSRAEKRARVLHFIISPSI